MYVLQDAETKHMEEIEKGEKEKLDLQDKLEEMIKQEAALTAKVRSFILHVYYIKQKPEKNYATSECIGLMRQPSLYANKLTIFSLSVFRIKVEP